MSTYGARLRAKLDPKHPTNQSFGQRRVVIPDHVVEAAFQQKLTGGFNPKKSNRCPVCFMAKSANGTCNCE